jgi:VCBS repeat-containing protein
MLNAVLALNELDTTILGSQEPSEAPRVHDDHVTVPDAHLLFNGEFKRVGTSDLKIVGDDGQSFFIRDYFAADKRAALMSPEGATLSAHVVEALAGPLAAGQLAQAGGQAASAQAVIGRVDALSGSATVVRNGVTVALNVGDTVRKGDVVQTSGSSSVAIVFADGTTFSLNANARMVLNDFVYAAGGTGNAAAISLVQGAFSFVAGQVAKTGDMRVETPVATMGIRGTAVLVEISAVDGKTNFSVMVEPDGTTGSFNLYNKTTGALIATVSNSNLTWEVTPAGFVSEVAKSPAQLQQELGLVQQIFTIFNNNQQNPFVPQQDRGDLNSNTKTADGGGGSSTPPPGSDGNSNSLVNAINQASGNPASLPVSSTVSVPEKIPGPSQTQSEPPPTTEVTVTVTPNRSPIAVDDSGQPNGGNVVGNDSDPEGSIIVVRSVQHIDPQQNVPAGPVVQVDDDGEQIVGDFGTLTIRADGTYTFVASGTAFQQLAAGEQAVEKFQYTITDPFGGTATAILTVQITGANDAPVVTGVVSGSATEDGPGVTLNALANASDIDDDVLVVSLPSELPAGVTFNSETGTFTLDPGNSAYQSLAAGQQTTVTVAYGVSDGTVTTPASVSWTINGTNDAPVVTGSVSGAAIEDGAPVALDALLNASDVDSALLSVVDVPELLPAGVTYDSETGKFTLDPSNSAYEPLAPGEQTIVTVNYGISDGITTTPASVSWTVTGTNHVPVAADVTLQANVLGNGGFEALPNFEGWTVDLGTDLSSVSFSTAEIDRSGTIFEGDDAVAVLSFSGQVAQAGSAGSGPSITSDAFTANAGDTIRFVYQLSSGSSSGSSDRGTVVGRIIDVETGEVVQEIYNEADLGQSTGVQTVNVQLEHSGEFKIEFEVGSVDDTFGYVVGARLDLGFAGILRTGVSEDAPFTFGADAFTADAQDEDGDTLVLNTVGTSANGALVYINSDGTVTYDPTTAAAIQSLAAGETLTDTFTFTLRDSYGGVSNEATATINVVGVNDAPVIGQSVLSGTVTEDAAANTASGALSASDVDNEDILTWSIVGQSGQQQTNSTTVQGTFGTLTINQAGEWTYTLDNGRTATQALNASDHPVESFTVKVADAQGAFETRTVTVTVNGADEPLTAVNDTRSMNENDVLFIDVLDNDALGATNKSLVSLGTATITGPQDVPLGQPAIVIEGGQIRVTPGTAFDTLAAGQTATIVVPYTIEADGIVSQATATITVHGTNDVPYFSVLPGGYQSVGTITPSSSFEGTDALKLTTAGATAAEMETFLGLSQGTLAATSAQDAPSNLNLNPTEGSAIAFDLVMAAGETITFSWNFASTEYTPYNDFAFFSFAPATGDKLADIVMIGDNVNDSFLHSSGWVEYSFTATSDGVYRLGIGVVDTGDSAFDSQLYISGFSGLGFSRTVDEDAGPQEFNLLQGALDPDTSDVLSAVNVAVTATDQNGSVVGVAGAYTISGGILSINPGAFDYLGAGQSVTIVASYGVTDGITTTQNSATLVVNGVGEPETQPVSLVVQTDDGFNTDEVLAALLAADVIADHPDSIFNSENGTGHAYLLYDAGTEGVNDDLLFRITATDLQWTGSAQDDTLTLTGGTVTEIQIYRNGIDNSPLEIATFTGLTIPAESIQAAIDAYDQSEGTDPSAFFSLFDAFEYNVTGGGGADTLIGGNLSDTIDGGAGSDTLTPWGGHDVLTGGAGHDTFVFGPGAGHDVITDMTLGSWTQNADADLIVINASVEDVVFGQNEQGDLRIIFGDDWVDLTGISHTTQLDTHNLIFTGGPLGV